MRRGGLGGEGRQGGMSVVRERAKYFFRAEMSTKF